MTDLILKSKKNRMNYKSNSKNMYLRTLNAIDQSNGLYFQQHYIFNSIIKSDWRWWIEPGANSKPINSGICSAISIDFLTCWRCELQIRNQYESTAKLTTSKIPSLIRSSRKTHLAVVRKRQQQEWNRAKKSASRIATNWQFIYL